MREKTREGKRISFIINPQAARNKWQRRKKLRNYLRKNLPGQIIDIHGKKEDTIEAVKKQSTESNIIVAVGGDGTVADVIQGITESGKKKGLIFGVIPLGSGNAFRKSLRIPKNVKKAIALLHEDSIQVMDLIDIEGRVASFASIGATAKVTQKKLQRNIPGILGHLLAARTLFTLPKKNLEIELMEGMDDEGRSFEKKTIVLPVFDCVIGKTNHFGYSWKIAPKAELDNGLLDITLFETSGLKYLLLFPLIYFGIFQKTQKHFKAKRVKIRGQNLAVQYNGEFLGVKDKISLSILPHALKIIAPKKPR